MFQRLLFFTCQYAHMCMKICDSGQGGAQGGGGGRRGGGGGGRRRLHSQALMSGLANSASCASQLAHGIPLSTC